MSNRKTALPVEVQMFAERLTAALGERIAEMEVEAAASAPNAKKRKLIASLKTYRAHGEAMIAPPRSTMH